MTVFDSTDAEINSALARSRELEVEETNRVRSLQTAGDEFTDDPNDNVTVAILGNDHIDFLDHGDSRVEYEDDFRDEEEDDDDEEERGIYCLLDGNQEETTKR